MKYAIVKSNVVNDMDDIVLIGKRNLRNISKNRDVWQYQSNPHGIAHNWLVKDNKNGKYVGTATLFPKQIYINGHSVLSAIAGDFAVDKKHRVFGPAINLQKAIQSSIKDNMYEFIYAFPNKQSKPIFLRIEYKEIARVKRYVKLLKTEYKFKQYIGSKIATKMLSKGIDIVMQLCSKERKFRKMISYNISNPQKFDEKFDNLWEKVSKQYPIIGVRNAQFLNWKFIQTPLKKHFIFSVLDPERELVGYVVYYIDNNIGYIVDMVFREKKFFEIILAKFILYLRSKEYCAISILYAGANWVVKNLKKYGFYYRDSDISLLIHVAKEHPACKCLSDQNNWLIFDGDNDG